MGFDWIELTGNLLLFLLVFGMSATVDMRSLVAQMQNRKAIVTCLCLQFGLLPLLGFCVVKILELDEALGITLLVVTSSPGGSYSNLWCSMFNADLALSVTMTAISTLLSTIMLPLNLCIYSKYSYDDDVLAVLDWVALFSSLVVVIGAIGLGIFCSAKVHSHRFNVIANKLGNFAGIALVVFSALMSNSGGGGNEDGNEEGAKNIFNREWKFYVGVASPCLVALLISNIVTTATHLKRPERVTVSVECCYQNVGIATSVALAMFDGNDLKEAMGVPLFYGIVEAVFLAFYCIVAWKFNWTKAPKNISLCQAIGTSYEVFVAESNELKSVEVTLADDDSRGETISVNGDTLLAYFRMDTLNDIAQTQERKEPSGLEGMVINREMNHD